MKEQIALERLTGDDWDRLVVERWCYGSEVSPGLAAETPAPQLRLEGGSIHGPAGAVRPTAADVAALDLRPDQGTEPGAAGPELVLVRAYLAAHPGTVWRPVAETLAALGLGIALGVGVSLLSAPAVRTLLYELEPRDPATMSLAAAALSAPAAAVSEAFVDAIHDVTPYLHRVGHELVGVDLAAVRRTVEATVDHLKAELGEETWLAGMDPAMPEDDEVLDNPYQYTDYKSDTTRGARGTVFGEPGSGR